jgi:hypothetical protein
MDKLTEEFESLSSDDLAVLRTLLDIPSSAGKNALAKALLTFGGIDRVFSRLSSNEVKAVHLLSRSATGLTFGDLSRELELETDDIEKISKSLHSKALVYILKNRKHLNNRLDKVYLQPIIADILSFSKDDEFIKSLTELNESLADKHAKAPDLSKKTAILVSMLVEAGGVTTFAALSESNGADAETVLSEALQKGLVQLHHAPAAPFATMISLTPKGFAGAQAKKESPQKSSINNRYYLLNNVLTAYDIVTSRGLYLTQQHEFRKTDFKRVSDALIPLYDQRGMTIDPDESARFALHILYRMGTLSLKKEAVQIDLNPIEKYISDPEKFSAYALRSTVKKHPDDTLFSSPFPMPSAEEIEALIDFIEENPGTEFTRLRMSFIIGKMMKNPSLLRMASDNKMLPGEKFTAALRYAFLYGMVRLDNGIYSVREKSEDGEAKKPASYINPDYTIMVPAEEISGEMLYKVLSCTEIKQNDVVMQCRITRDSILSAHKRRMNPDKMITEFEPYLKNGIPQNMHFMIREWISQSLEVSIREALILKTNHPSFIDDLLAGNLKSTVIERISPHHALVKRDSIDEIVRAATKQSAIISLFGE